MSKQHVVIECNCAPILIDILGELRRQGRRLDVVEDAVSGINTTLQSIDDFQDVLDAQGELKTSIDSLLQETPLTSENK